MPQRVFTLTVTVAVVATLICGKAGAATLTRKEASLLKVMNHVRASHGLRPLRVDARLERVARGHSRQMLRSQTIFHGNFVRRVRSAGVLSPRIGENLAWGTGSLARAGALVNAWLASPEHRANLLHRGYRTVGVGALPGSFDGYAGATLVTADFAGR